MRRVIFISLISVLFLNTVLAEGNVSGEEPKPAVKEPMVFGEYLLRPKAELPEEAKPAESKSAEAAENKENESKTSEKEDAGVIKTIQIPMAEPNMSNDKNSVITPVKLDVPAKTDETFDVGNEGEQTLPIPEVKKAEPVQKSDEIEGAYKSEKEILQEKVTPDPDPETEDEKFVKTEEIEEADDTNVIDLDVTDTTLFKNKTEQPQKIVPEKIEFEKKPIFNIPSQNHGANIDNTTDKISSNFMKGAIPSVEDYKLNQQLAVKDIYADKSPVDKKETKEEVILNIYNSDKVDLNLKGRPLKYENGGFSHSLVNVGTVLRF